MPGDTLVERTRRRTKGWRPSRGRRLAMLREFAVCSPATTTDTSPPPLPPPPTNTWRTRISTKITQQNFPSTMPRASSSIPERIARKIQAGRCKGKGGERGGGGGGGGISVKIRQNRVYPQLFRYNRVLLCFIQANQRTGSGARRRASGERTRPYPRRTTQYREGIISLARYPPPPPPPLQVRGVARHRLRPHTASSPSTPDGACPPSGVSGSANDEGLDDSPLP